MRLLDLQDYQIAMTGIYGNISYGVLNPGIKQLMRLLPKIEYVERKLKVRPFGLLSGDGQAALNFNWLSLVCLACLAN